MESGALSIKIKTTEKGEKDRQMNKNKGSGGITFTKYQNSEEANDNDGKQRKIFQRKSKKKNTFFFSLEIIKYFFLSSEKSKTKNQTFSVIYDTYIYTHTHTHTHTHIHILVNVK